MYPSLLTIIYKMTSRIMRYTLMRKYLLFLIVLVFLFIIMLLHKGYVSNKMNANMDRKVILIQMDEAIKNSHNAGACKQPDLPVFSPEMMKFVKYVPPVDCKAAPKDWVVCKNSECEILPEIIAQKGPIKCSFADIIRYADSQNSIGETTNSNSYYKLEESDTVKVACYSADESWNSVLTSIRYDQSIMDRTGWEYVPKDGLAMNVLIFAIDSLSRNTVIRKLPKTFSYINSTLNGLLLEGYNIVGDGTPQALTPILTGHTELELPDTRKRSHGANYMDVYPFLWKNFSKAGYVTGYLEDAPYTGTYTYRMNGFLKQPTDHYMRPYFLSIGKFLKKWPQYCAGSVPRHQVMFNYVKSYFEVYKSKPKFMFAFHSELSHDDYNLIEAADEDIMNFLKDLNDSGALNNTMMIVMADHGHRFTDIRNTMQGKLEERLPFFSFVFPKWFKNKHPQAYSNFKSNLKTLVTPFDIYATLSSMLHVGNLGDADMTERSLSLFSKISKNRSCSQAYIEPHWCACLNWISVNLEEDIVNRLSRMFERSLNNYTATHRDRCAELKVSDVFWVNKLTANEHLIKFKRTYDYDGFVPDLTGETKISANIYQLKVKLTPGDGLFEATIKHHLKEDQMLLKETDISRINMYGSQPKCVADKFPHLRPYCYCIVD